MLDAVVADMRRGKIGYVLVKDRLGVSVWRSLRTAQVGVSQSDPSARPSPHPMGRGREFLSGKSPGVALVPRLPRATILNPAGVLKLRRRSSAS